jgi:hypothetical protein
MKNKYYTFLLLPFALISKLYNCLCAINSKINYKNTYNLIKNRTLLFPHAYNNLSNTFFVAYIAIRQSAYVWEVITHILRINPAKLSSIK